MYVYIHLICAPSFLLTFPFLSLSLSLSEKVSSMETELEGYLGRGLRHGNLVQYLSMTHQLSDNKIVVEVRVHKDAVSCTRG